MTLDVISRGAGERNRTAKQNVMIVRKRQTKVRLLNQPTWT
jgi:hypothetical protein